jgi:hypothetical protein
MNNLIILDMFIFKLQWWVLLKKGARNDKKTILRFLNEQMEV